ncbi:hypothetical protein R3W88_029839 [Solanum pinnatisectum]|uniref:RNase H type-1 domain-containing protein n=1 Tax=Solanum pinnatisectum TaxID=50273 RepID=A0AAV9K6F8_9SOLN|nr:hypothetical protein R3W88_029839 [Solanum pinnatisectum]
MEFHLVIVNKRKRNTKKLVQVKWNPPDPGTYKFNLDGAIKNSPGPGGLGGVIRNDLGGWVMGFIEPIPMANPVRAELQAMRRGLSLAVQKNLSPIEINSDSPIPPLI